MDLTQFIAANEAELKKHYGYELTFTRDVLARVPGLDFTHVHHFETDRAVSDV